MIIKCPECGKEVTNTVPRCMYCGYNLHKTTTVKHETITTDDKPSILIFLCTVVASLIFLKVGVLINIICIFIYKKYKVMKNTHALILLLKMIFVLLVWLSFFGIIKFTFNLPTYFIKELLKYMNIILF